MAPDKKLVLSTECAYSHMATAPNGSLLPCVVVMMVTLHLGMTATGLTRFWLYSGNLRLEGTWGDELKLIKSPKIISMIYIQQFIQ